MDDHIPINMQKNIPMFSRNHGDELWVILLEKAYAKVFGCYAAIESGLTGVAMSNITGAPY